MQTHDTMKIKIILPVLLAIALLSACKKDITPITTLAETKSGTNNPVNQRAQLPNPFEYLGVLHNQAMDHVKNSRGFQHFDNYQRYSAAYAFINQKYPSVKMNQSEFDLFRSEINQLVDADNAAPKVLFSKGRIDLQTKTLLDRIFQIFDKYQASSEAPSADVISQQLISFETDVIKQFGCPSNNLSHNSNIAAVLASSAIARYSYYYWYTVSKDYSNPWNNVFSDMAEKSTINWGQVWRTVKADFIGFWSSDGQTGGSLDIETAACNSLDASAGA
jgi:hypothetical protein